jgi:hypothetical protein
MQADKIYSVEGLPSEWGGVVADFVKSRAEQYEPIFSMTGNYRCSLEDEKLRENFTQHAKLYSNSLWKWCSEGVPEHIKKWVEGSGGVGPKAHPIDRLSYLIYRREVMEWWTVRSRTQQTPKQLRYEAVRFMSCVKDLELAVAVQDFDFFEHVIKEKRQTRANKIDFNAGYFLMVYWMIWSLWKESLDEIVSIFFRQLKVNVGRSRIGELINDLGLRTPKK